MKRWILPILILLLLLSACSRESPKYKMPVQLYYCTATADNDISPLVIDTVTAEGSAFANDPVGQLNEYLKGTGEDGFRTTFPASTKLLSLEIDGDTALLTVNTALSRLSGAELSLACACLCLTTMDLTGVNAVTISASGSTLGGAQSITMTRDSLILQDLYDPEST